MIFIIILLGAILTGCTTELTRTTRNQLEELNPTSYNDIRNWITSETPEYTFGEFHFATVARDTNGNLIKRDFLDDESRFVEWSFYLGLNSLEITLTYLTFEEVIEKQLSQIERTSLAGIEEWIEKNENVDEIEIQVIVVDTNENIMHHFDIDIGRDFFVEWDFTISEFLNTYRIRFEYVLEVAQTVSLGEPFVLAGMQFTFEDNITGGRVDNYWSLDDEQPYINVPVEMKNISDEVFDFFRFRIAEFGPDGAELDSFFASSMSSVILMRALPHGEIHRGHFSFRYDGDGEYRLIVSSMNIRIPFSVEVLVPVNNVDIPDAIDRYSRDVPLPDVVYDLPDLTLFNHNLSNDSFFYSVSYETEAGNTYMILSPNDIVRDPEGVITHDSLRVRYRFFEYDSQKDSDAVSVMKRWANTLQQGGNPYVIIGSIRATEDRMTALVQTRRGVGNDLSTRLFVIQILPCGNEYVLLETWLWTLTETTLRGERRTAIEEFGELTGIDFIGILRETFEG